MRIFVLGTGRCGTTTFIRACEHLDNYSAGHETRSRMFGDARLDYPDDHIEADNRLSWLLGPLGDRFGDDDVLYVHLRRRADDVVRSFERRWDSGYRAGIMGAFGHGIIMRSAEYSPDEVHELCSYYVDVVTANITTFLAGRRSTELWLHELTESFGDFTQNIGATGDLEAAAGELHTRHNESHPATTTEGVRS